MSLSALGHSVNIAMSNSPYLDALNGSAQRKRKAAEADAQPASPPAADVAAAVELTASPTQRAAKRTRVNSVRRDAPVRSRKHTMKQLLQRRALKVRKVGKLFKRLRFAQSPKSSGTASPASEPHVERDDAVVTDSSTLVIPKHLAALQQNAPEPMRLHTPPSDLLHRNLPHSLAIAAVDKSADALTKAHSQFAFKNAREPFNEFRNRFETFLEWRELADVLQYPVSSPPPNVSTEVFLYQQRTVYHMITQCAPKEVLQPLRDSCSHDGFAAWKFLKDRFLGDEKLYVQRLETQLSDTVWSAAEPFAVFESRVLSILSEHALATGRDKQEYEKQSIFMRAIRNGRSQADYLRLNQVHLIHTKSAHSYDMWLSGIREEARHIEEYADEVAQRKRSLASSAPVQPSMQISALDSHHPGARTSFPPMPATRGPVVCRNWERSNGQRCTYGDACKFAHAAPSSRPAGNRGSGAAPIRHGKKEGALPEVCRAWSNTGSCRYGENCRYQHIKSESSSHQA